MGHVAGGDRGGAGVRFCEASYFRDDSGFYSEQGWDPLEGLRGGISVI